MDTNSVFLFTLIAILQTCFAPPVTQIKKESEQPSEDSGYGGLENYMEYHRYLREVVNTLESDQEFRQKLEKADESEIKSGKIAEELQFVSHHVRSRLDELKRVELQRLKELTEKKMKLEQQSNVIGEDPIHHHLDQTNLHTFEIEDLKKLISKTTQDLAEADKLRKEEFKQYEMEKEYQKLEKLNHTSGAEREKLEKEYQEMEQKHRNHEKLHEPGHKAQLEEVWKEQDQMQQDFDPRTFFLLHDIDGNGLWDQEEVKALFIKELDKMYQQGAPEDDMRERIEELERIREHLFREMDSNRDGFIDYKEFLKETNSKDFKQDHGWQGLDEQTKPYTDEELAEYVRYHHAAGPQYGQAHPQYPQGGYQQVPPGAYQQQFHPGQVPQMVPQQLDLNTNEIHPGQPQPPQYPAIPQQQYANHPQQNLPHNPPQYQQGNVVNNLPQHQNNQQQNVPPQYQPENVQPQYQQGKAQPQYQHQNAQPQEKAQPQYKQEKAQPQYQQQNAPPQYQQGKAQPQYQQQNTPPQYQQPNIVQPPQNQQSGGQQPHVPAN